VARIRTIKPEFPQSESMGRISRDARLMFIQMWPLADDSGRLRGNSRMLASLLVPYDDDAPSLIDGWIAELEQEGCIVRYLADGQTYVEICNWLIHQKIDKPSQSKIPAFDESSRILANPRECSSLDQGSRIKDQGVEASPRGSRLTHEELPKEWRDFCQSDRPDLDPDPVFARFADYWRAQPGAKGRKSDWLATWRNWVRDQRVTPRIVASQEAKPWAGAI